MFRFVETFHHFFAFCLSVFWILLVKHQTEIIGSYETLKKYKDDHAFKNAVIKLKNVLDNDESIRMISEHENTTRVEIKNYFKEIG